jgi:ABC-2 type transport system permease protein
VSALASTMRVLRVAGHVGYVDNTSIYTLRTWLIGWMTRVVAQVVFFALIGRLVDDPDVTRFLVVGNLVMLAMMSTIMGAVVITWDRMKGVLPHMVAAPSSATAALIGRLAFPAAQGVATTLLATPIVLLLFDVPLEWREVPILTGLLLVTVASAAGLSSSLGALLLHRTRWRNLGSNITIFTMMVCCGVNVPLEATPDALAAVGRMLPMTHGLLAIRAVLSDTGAAIAPLVARELLTGAAWLAASLPLFAYLIRHGRKTGTLDHA